MAKEERFEKVVERDINYAMYTLSLFMFNFLVITEALISKTYFSGILVILGFTLLLFLIFIMDHYIKSIGKQSKR